MGAYDTRWVVDGTMLNQVAWHIEDLSSSEDVPPLRGENWLIPYKAGRMWVPKYEDQRTFALGMWVADVDPATGLPPVDEDARVARYNQNLQTIKDLFVAVDDDGRQTGLLNLEKHVYLGGGTWRTLTGQGELANTMEFQPEGSDFARFVVELIMPDPYWYDGAAKYR